MPKDKTTKKGTPLERAEEVRKQGLRRLKEGGIAVFQTRQEVENESIEEKERWGRVPLHTLLRGGVR